MYVVASSSFPLYLIEILHQTTTDLSIACLYCGCILLKFYIKPQQHAECLVKSYCCILLKFYIKPQLHHEAGRTRWSCILLKFYIKPQQYRTCIGGHRVVSYWNSTSNHNRGTGGAGRPVVVSYWNSTSNHNHPLGQLADRKLYLIEILHQTTTHSYHIHTACSCILLKFYIKPQRRVRYLLDFSVLRRLSGRKTERENSVEVSLMCFLYFKERKYCFFRKIPTAAACPVLPVHSCPRSWECLHTVCLSQTEYS